MNTAYRGRVRTGCLACRAAKVKCDEQHPVCRRCVRQHKDCVYAKARKRTPAASPTKEVDGESPALSTPPPIITPRSAYSPGRSLGSPSRPASEHYPQASPSLLSTLVSQDIYLCTTIDYIAAVEGRPSYTYFQQHFGCPFLTPYDPANWVAFKEIVLAFVTQSEVLAKATEAAQAVHRARKNALPLGQALQMYSTACDLLKADYVEEGTTFDILFAAVFVLALVEMMIPEETSPGFLSQPTDSAFMTMQKGLNSPSALATRLAAWLLICHAAARRSGNRGLLSASFQEMLEATFDKCTPIPPLERGHVADPDHTLLAALTEPLFVLYVQMQIISAHVADLSHYHRSRTTGEDQEQVAAMMATYRSQIDEVWSHRPALMQHGAGELRSRFTSSGVAEALDLLCTLCALTFDTEMVEMGRNLSQEQSTTPEARTRLKQIKSLIETWMQAHEGQSIHAAFLRALMLCAIESHDQAESQWAVAAMRGVHDPISYSDFFANFSDGLADTQRRMSRRVTTKWFALQTFGVSLPFL